MYETEPQSSEPPVRRSSAPPPLSVVVKFLSSVNLPYEDGVKVYFEEAGIHPLGDEILRNATFERVFTAMTPDEID